MYEEGRYQTRHTFRVAGIDISAGAADTALRLSFDRDMEIMNLYLHATTEAGGAFGAGGAAGRVSADKIATDGTTRTERTFGTVTTGAASSPIGSILEPSSYTSATLLRGETLVVEHETAQTAGAGSADGVYEAVVVARELWDEGDVRR